jgi:hypothetical protein
MLVAKCINNCIMETRVETRLNARHTHTLLCFKLGIGCRDLVHRYYKYMSNEPHRK